jgi:ribosomal protein L37AE/L43A
MLCPKCQDKNCITVRFIRDNTSYWKCNVCHSSGKINNKNKQLGE